MKLRANIFRRLLALSLLMLFASEHVALASVISVDTPAVTHQYNFVPAQGQAVFCLLAEESEERAQKDEIALPLEREVLHSLLSPVFVAIQYPLNPGNPYPVRSLPIYSVHCSFLI